MLKKNLFFLSIFIVFFSSNLYCSSDIQLIKKENQDSNTTLLVIGGIHGNEPGGYFSAEILATHYTITSKNLWIIPNLNKASIQKNKRGIHGDMNRKFASLKKSDKDANIVKGVEKIILSKKVSLILNLHDGHGFYRRKNQGNIFNPNAWGQTCVIDQCSLNQHQPFGDLDNIAKLVKNKLNKKLIKQHHSFDVRNTNTKFDDEEMQLSLTYFAVTNNKPAFAIESSKNLSSLSQKVFYQLLAIEEFMNIMKIKFTRDFKLNEKSLSKIIKKRGNLNINGNILLDLTNIKKSLSYIPLKYTNNSFIFSNLLGSVNKNKNNFDIYIGNKKITTLKPDYFNMQNSCLKSFKIKIDGKIHLIDIGSDFFVKKSFKILNIDGIRVNIIGFKSKKTENESGVNIDLKHLNSWYSVDKNKRVYRIEFYKKNKFCFMSKVHFKRN